MAKLQQKDPSVDSSTAQDAEESRTRMTFGEHLEELRKCVLRAGFGVVITVGVCLLFMYQIFDFIVRPYRIALQAHGIPPVFITLKPQEAFFTLINLSFRAGLIVASPWIIYQFWKFVGAGLYRKERKIIYRYVGPSALLFLAGVAFFYVIVLPMTLNFFLNFTAHSGGLVPTPSYIEEALGLAKPPASAPAPAGTNPATLPAPLRIPELAQDPPPPPPGEALLFFNTTDSRVVIMRSSEKRSVQTVAEDALFANTWRADDYLNFVFFTALVFGLAFELPMVILVLAQTDIVRARTFRNIRKYAYFGILIGAVIAAPSGDLMTLAFLFVPLVLLYEVGIIAAAIATRGRVDED
jgi:sec-independent protein translocase protein TatC